MQDADGRYVLQRPSDRREIRGQSVRGAILDPEPARGCRNRGGQAAGFDSSAHSGGAGKGLT